MPAQSPCADVAERARSLHDELSRHFDQATGVLLPRSKVVGGKRIRTNVTGGEIGELSKLCLDRWGELCEDQKQGWHYLLQRAGRDPGDEYEHYVQLVDWAREQGCSMPDAPISVPARGVVNDSRTVPQILLALRLLMASPGAPKDAAPVRTKRRGRPQDTDAEADRRVYDAWKTGNYKTHSECAGALRKSKLEFGRAIDRHKKRLAKQSRQGG